MGLGRVRTKKMFSEAIIHRILETNPNMRNSTVQENFNFYFSRNFR